MQVLAALFTINPFTMWDDFLEQLSLLPPYLSNLVLGAAALLSGLVFKFIATRLLKLYSKKKVDYSLFRSILFRLNRPMTFFLLLFTLSLVLPLMELTKGQLYFIDRITSICLIITFSLLLIAVVGIFEDFFVHLYDLKKADNLRERKIRTQLQFIRKLAISLIIIVAVGTILLSFSSLRRIGTGLLTGVGIGGIIVGFAAQKSLGNLLAGLQIAFTQPIRIDDVLVVEGEFGHVEEITLTYVVLKIWDQRSLILPITYFLEKPFQNWTRTNSEILGTVFLYLDYTAPFDTIRTEFLLLLQTTGLWDKRVSGMQVTNTTAGSVEIRLLMSAANAAEAFDLRCYIREKIIAYIQQNFAYCLPKTRAEFLPGKSATLPAKDSKPAPFANENNETKRF